MIAMPLTCPDISREQTSRHCPAATVQDSRPTGILPGGRASLVTAPFAPLDPGIVNEAIPAFFIGRNKEGFWVAREAGGQLGGLFLLRRLQGRTANRRVARRYFRLVDSNSIWKTMAIRWSTTWDH